MKYNIFSFKGRAIRSEYWLINLPINILFSLIDKIAESASAWLFLGYLILMIPMTWIQLATNARRCHDLGHNGFWQLIPFYGIWMACVKGEETDNEYGPTSVYE